MNRLTTLLKQFSLKISVAESCTGGNLSALLTQKSGASEYFERGFITYSNQAKIDMLGVNSSTLNEFGAVSEEIAAEMVRGVILHSSSDIGVAITGISGPTGGTKAKPVGTVCFGFFVLDKYFTLTQNFTGNRRQIVQKSINFVVKILLTELTKT